MYGFGDKGTEAKGLKRLDPITVDCLNLLSTYSVSIFILCVWSRLDQCGLGLCFLTLGLLNHFHSLSFHPGSETAPVLIFPPFMLSLNCQFISSLRHISGTHSHPGGRLDLHEGDGQMMPSEWGCGPWGVASCSSNELSWYGPWKTRGGPWIPWRKGGMGVPNDPQQLLRLVLVTQPSMFEQNFQPWIPHHSPSFVDKT